MAKLFNRLSSTMIEANKESIEYHISNILLDNIYLIHNLSISEMASLCLVSKSTLSKFIRRLGFEDYKDFKSEALYERKKDEYMKDTNFVSVTDFIIKNGLINYGKILNEEITNLINKIDRKKILKLVDYIHDYTNIAAFGDVFSETASINLQFSMSFYHKFIYTTTKDIKQYKYIKTCDEDTLLIIFSNSGNYLNKDYYYSGRSTKNLFKQTNARIVLFTSNSNMEMDERVDLCINWEYITEVHNHPILYQILIEIITVEYQKKFGFPQEKL